MAYGSDAPAGDGGTLLGRPVVTYAALAGHAPLEDVAATGESGCALFTTSGTSSRPKFVLHDQRTLAAHACTVVRAWNLSVDSVTLLVPPLCGVFGLKPTFGRLSRRGSYPFVHSIDHLGPIADSVEALALSYDAMQGPDPLDPGCHARRVQPVASGIGRGIDGLRDHIA